MSFLLVAQRALTVPGWVKNALWRAAKATPSLDLPFADSKSLVDAITGRQLISYARASSGTYTDSAGVLRTAATDVPRFDHNPLTGESLGLLVEEQRTNFMINSGSISPNVALGTGTVIGPDGVNCRTLIPNAGSQNFPSIGGPQQAFTLASGQTIDWAWSGWVAAGPTGTVPLEPRFVFGVTVAGGASPTYAELQINTSNGTIRSKILGFSLTDVSAPTVTLYRSGLYRFTWVIRYTQDATGRNTVGAAMQMRTTGGAGTYTADGVSGVQYALLQAETGSTVSSTIPTTTDAATRNADVAQITGTNFSSWYRQDEGTMFAQYNSTTWNADANFPKSFAIGTDDSNGFWIGGDTADNVYRYRVRNGGVNQFGAATIPRTTITNNKTAIAVKASDFAVAADGGNLATGTTGSVPAATSMSIGSDLALNINFANQPIKRLTYWPQRLDNATLQAITQP